MNHGYYRQTLTLALFFSHGVSGFVSQVLLAAEEQKKLANMMASEGKKKEAKPKPKPKPNPEPEFEPNPNPSPNWRSERSEAEITRKTAGCDQ